MSWLRSRLSKIKPLNTLLLALALIALSGTAFAIIVFFKTAEKSDAFSQNMCFAGSCIENFAETFSQALAILNITGSLLGGVATLGGIIVALLSYINTAKSTAVSNHIAHLNIFITYIHGEIDKRDRLSKQGFDIMRWYNLMYQNSANGSLEISEDYKIFLKRLNADLNESNDLVKRTEHGGYRYKHHQENMKKRFTELGIELHSLPRLDFYEMESQLFAILCNVNDSFCRAGTVEKLAARNYL